jgi:hypothetical protein
MHFNIAHLGENAAIAQEQLRIGNQAEGARSASPDLTAKRVRRCFRAVLNEGPDPGWQRGAAEVTHTPKPD